jgi:hypothetical protein
LYCDRFAAARSTAICLRLKPGSLPPLTDMIVLDANLHERHRETLPGTPSRARVSPDGRIVNWTLFVTGDSYAATGFSTRTGLYEVDTGRLVKTITSQRPAPRPSQRLTLRHRQRLAFARTSQGSTPTLAG